MTMRIEQKDLEALVDAFHLIESATETKVKISVYATIKEKTPLWASATAKIQEMNEDFDEVKNEPIAPTVEIKTLIVEIPLSYDVLYHLVTGNYIMGDEPFAFRATIDGQHKYGEYDFSSRDHFNLFKDSTVVELSASGDVMEWVHNSEQAEKKNPTASAEQMLDEVVAAGKFATDKSQILKVLEDGPDLTETDDPSQFFEFKEAVEDLPEDVALYLMVGGNMSTFLIAVQNGPEAAYRYIAAKTEMDLDEVVKMTTQVSKEEVITILNEVEENFY